MAMNVRNGCPQGGEGLKGGWCARSIRNLSQYMNFEPNARASAAPERNDEEGQLHC